MIKVQRALISVSDKTGLAEFARGLHAQGVELLSTGGTAKLLRSNNIPVRDVSDYTGFPEILDGRVKTLHPAIHGGLLALRDKLTHQQQIKEHDIVLIDMVVVNLYPFAKVTAKKGVSLDEAIENIDIGGPSMLRSAAKNFRSVAVISNPSRYKEVLEELNQNSGILPDVILRTLGVEAFSHTAQYDQMIFEFLNGRLHESHFEQSAEGLPDEQSLRIEKIQDLRYGENPHQSAGFYKFLGKDTGLATIKQLHGKELSFNNILDLNAAFETVCVFKQPAAVVIKHNNPTGIAVDASLAKAYSGAHACDPISAFGGIIGLNRKVDKATAEKITKSGFMECVIAPGFDQGALKILKGKKNLRLIQVKLSEISRQGYDYKLVNGGMLVQDRDTIPVKTAEWSCPSRKKPTKSQWAAMSFGWEAVRQARSNAIILVKGTKTVGIGCGQTSRIEAVEIAVKKAGKTRAAGSTLISDAFIPKTDNVALAAKAGIKVIVQTGGSIADKDVIAAADKAGIAMVMTGCRHFKH